jgi:predicted DNA binding CopG/RHH family protein
MKKKGPAEGAAEFDRRFDKGEDIHDIADLSKAKITHPGRKVRITLDIPEALVRDIDEVRARIGVDRGALIKVRLHERVAREKVG